jgi:hypothetical protein
MLYGRMVGAFQCPAQSGHFYLQLSAGVFSDTSRDNLFLLAAHRENQKQNPLIYLFI